MAALSKTIKNGVGVVGGGPASLWNAFNWNAFKWGEGSRDIGQNVVKGIASPVSPTTVMKGFSVLHQVSTPLTPVSTVGFRVLHLVTETFSPTSTIGLTLRHRISESITVTGDMSSESLRDAAGYRYNFPDRTSEGESRSFATWSSATSSSSGWTTAAAASTTWS